MTLIDTKFRASFFVKGKPKGQPRPRAFAFHGKARVFDPGTAEHWKSEIAVAAKNHAPPQKIEGPIRAVLSFYLPRPQRLCGKKYIGRDELPATCKPDADNLAKAVLDCLTTLGWWRDDAQVCNLSVSKWYHVIGEVPGMFMEIVEL